ncbi:MAG TPA: hypothetical protein VNY10_07195 [Roseiarcus sp.]|jgi:hypothetical protein|nr:hypothetical protein [Roseiarcus sp.]
MSDSVVQDAPANVGGRALRRKQQKLVGWLLLGFGLSLLPLCVTGIMEYRPGQNNLLDILSNEDILTVAFALSGAAAVDVLIDSRESVWKFSLGISTFLMTLVAIAGYIMFKGRLTHLPPSTIVFVTQLLYVVTVLLAFLCECTSEA